MSIISINIPGGKSVFDLSRELSPDGNIIFWRDLIKKIKGFDWGDTNLHHQYGQRLQQHYSANTYSTTSGRQKNMAAWWTRRKFLQYNQFYSKWRKCSEEIQHRIEMHLKRN